MVTWIDLDETLIAAAHNPRPGWTRIGAETWAILRPDARECLAALRALGHVRLLTSAPLSYAGEASTQFGLGFLREDIFAQELWSSFLRDQPSLGRASDVLVEDNRALALNAKCRFTGIPLSRAVVVPAFTGEPDVVLSGVPARVEQLLMS